MDKTTAAGAFCKQQALGPIVDQTTAAGAHMCSQLRMQLTGSAAWSTGLVAQLQSDTGLEARLQPHAELVAQL